MMGNRVAGWDEHAYLHFLSPPSIRVRAQSLVHRSHHSSLSATNLNHLPALPCFIERDRSPTPLSVLEPNHLYRTCRSSPPLPRLFTSKHDGVTAQRHDDPTMRTTQPQHNDVTMLTTTPMMRHHRCCPRPPSLHIVPTGNPLRVWVRVFAMYGCGYSSRYPRPCSCPNVCHVSDAKLF